MKKTAIITGASSGIGEACALSLAAAGYDLVLIARREDRLTVLSSRLSALGSQVQCRALDLADREAMKDFFAQEGELLSNASVLVNNAGLAKGTEKIQDAKLEDWDEMLEVNVRALFAFTRGVLPHFLKRREGHIVNIGSVAGRWVYPGGAVYCSTKHSVRVFTEGLRMDLIGTGIRVTNIEPGMVNTEFSLVRLGDQAAADRVYERMTPLKSEDIAESVLWCLQRPKHVNIQELMVFPTDQAAVGQVHRSKE